MTNLYAGYATLVSKKSAKETVKNLNSFELAKLKGFRRVFGKVNPFCVMRDTVDWSNNRVSACYIYRDENAPSINISIIDVPHIYQEDIRDRERDYREEAVSAQLIKTGERVKTHIYVGYETDEQMHREIGSDVYKSWPLYTKKYDGPNYRTDIFPSNRYLKLCLQAYSQQGDEYLNNFLDVSLLADRKTSLREYVQSINWDVHNPDSWV